MSSGSSPTSSMNRVPLSASSNRPIRRCKAPVKAPFSWPNSSLSTTPCGIAPQLTLMSGRSRRGLPWCIARAISSLPVPVSPVSSTVVSTGATCCTFRSTARSAGLSPDDTFEPPLLGDLFLEICVLHHEPVAIPLDLPVQLGVPDREPRLIGKDAEQGELLGRDPAAGEKTDRAQLLALKLEGISGCTTDPHLPPQPQRARGNSEPLELPPLGDEDRLAQAPLDRGGQRGIRGTR